MLRKILLLVIALWFLFFSVSAGAEELRYRDYEESMRTAGPENKLVMVFFWADWCFYCNKIRQEVFSEPAIHEIFDRDFLAVSVNVENDPEGLAGKYRARVLPTLTFLKPDGEIVGYWEGAADKGTFLKILEYLVTEVKAGEDES